MVIIAPVFTSLSLSSLGYIAGVDDGIVTVAGKSASRKIWLLDALTLAVKAAQWSLDNGHYAFFGLNPANRYLVMVRDYKKEYEPFVWDDVLPATDKTIVEQQSMWQGFQPK